jgi:DDE superfamily endonuclease
MVPIYYYILLLMPRLRRDEAQGFRSSGGVVEPAVRLGETLRVIADASYIDIMLTFRIAKPTVFDVFWSTVQVINESLKLPELHLGNENELRRLAIDFNSSRSPYSPLHGRVGALDGVLFKISKPADKYHPAKYYCRKGYYAIPLQVLVDSRYKVLYVSAKCAGATHDNLAFYVSTLHHRLMSGELQTRLVLALTALLLHGLHWD